MMKIKVFDYHKELRLFTIRKEYDKTARYLGLNEWSTVVWIGRLFTLDNDYGEHWFDNWELRDKMVEKAHKIGLDYDDLMIIDPNRMQNGKDGPCHTNEQRFLFWRDVLCSLELGLDLMISVARSNKKNWEEIGYTDDELNDGIYVPDLENRIEILLKKYSDE